MFRLFLVLCALLPSTLTWAANRPVNILFAIADDWGPHASAYGTPWIKTPAFDRVASEGLLFLRAYTPAAKCAPSRASVLTGRYPWQLKEAANHICYFPQEFKGWGEALAENGWFVGHTQKGWGPGSALGADGKPRQMTGRAFNERKTKPATEGISNNDYAANFRDFLEATPAGQPWCFWFGSVEPHRGYEFGSGVAKGGKKLTDIDRVPSCWPDNDTVRHDMLDYAFEAEDFDRHLGLMLAELDRRGLLDSTLVIVTSDHGMPFPRSKGNAGELPNHVPLAIRWPTGIKQPGRRVSELVSFVDLAPTLVQAAGLPWSKTGMAPTAGRSLFDLFQPAGPDQPKTPRDHVLIGRERNDIGRPHDEGYPVRGIIQGNHLYLRNLEPSRWPAGNPETGYLDCDAGATKSLILRNHRANPSDPFWAMCFGLRSAEEFYDLSTDPDGLRNLATASTPPPAMAALRALLDSRLKEQGDPRILGQGQVFDAYKHANKGHQNFYERYMSGEKLKTPWVSDDDYEPKVVP